MPEIQCICGRKYDVPPEVQETTVVRCECGQPITHVRHGNQNCVFEVSCAQASEMLDDDQPCERAAIPDEAVEAAVEAAWAALAEASHETNAAASVRRKLDKRVLAAMTRAALTAAYPAIRRAALEEAAKVAEARAEQNAEMQASPLYSHENGASGRANFAARENECNVLAAAIRARGDADDR